jgi:hypothetical protein
MNSGYRRAALALRGLASEDQDRLLAELPEIERSALRDLLGELDELGFEPGLPQEAGALVPVADRHSPRYRVATASVEQIAGTLAGEPPVLVAQLLRMERWPWRDALLAHMPPARRLAVGAAMDTASAAPARDRQLLEMLARSIGPAAAAVPPTPRMKRGLLHKVSSWIR